MALHRVRTSMTADDSIFGWQQSWSVNRSFTCTLGDMAVIRRVADKARLTTPLAGDGRGRGFAFHHSRYSNRDDCGGCRTRRPDQGRMRRAVALLYLPRKRADQSFLNDNRISIGPLTGRKSSAPPL
jgi:hypothetical protein